VGVLLDAWKLAGLNQAELLLVGDPQPEIRQILSTAHLPGVQLIGFSREVLKYYRMANVFVFPSTCEGSAKATYEAGACGLASISTAEAGDFVDDGVNGYLVPLGDAPAIAERLQHFKDHPETVRQMGRAARRKVLRECTWEHYRQKLEKAYNLALQ
jgi:glycosyltransferase involved in cell wall biosynthesis